MAKMKYYAGAFAASIILPQLTDPVADELFGICPVQDDIITNGYTPPALVKPPPAVIEARPEKLGIHEIFGAVSQDQRYIGLLDTNHSIGDIRFDVYSDEFIEHYKAMDVRTFFIERDKTGQQSLTQFLEGEITSDELYYRHGLNSGWVGSEKEAITQHTYIAGQMLKMHEAGITIQGIDYISEMPDIPLKVTALFLDDLTQTVQNECGNAEITDAAAAYHAVSRTWMTLTSFPFIMITLNHRKNETELGHLIEAETEKNGGRSAIFYGAAHFENIESSFVTAIGKDQFFNLALANADGYEDEKTKIDAVYDTKNDHGTLTNETHPLPEPIRGPEI